MSTNEQPIAPATRWNNALRERLPWLNRVPDWVKALVIALLVGAAVLAWAVLGSNDANGTEAGATNACETFVETRLKAPSTADFGDTSATQDGASWTIRGVVDSENSLGVPIRNAFDCTVSVEDSNWSLVALDITEN